MSQENGTGTEDASVVLRRMAADAAATRKACETTARQVSFIAVVVGLLGAMAGLILAGSVLGTLLLR